MAEQRKAAVSSEELKEMLKSPEFKKMVAMVDSGRLKDVTMLEGAKTTPVVRKKKMKAVLGNLFVMPGQVEETKREVVETEPQGRRPLRP